MPEATDAMSLHHITDPLKEFVERLSWLTINEHHDALFNEVIEQGGNWNIDADTGTIEITLHDIRAIGKTDQMAVLHWVRAARKNISGSADA